MTRLGSAVATVAVLSLSVSVALGQSVISARSGVIHYMEGKASLDGKPVEQKFGQFPDIKEGSVFRTGEGRAEILLTPGVFLRAGENSEVKMITNRLIDTRLLLEKGSVLIECAEIQKDTSVTFVVAGKDILLRKKGLFRLDASPSLLKVYDGETAISAAGVVTTVKEGRQVALDGSLLAAVKFNREEGDSLYRWAKRRAGYLAMANMTAARRIERGYVNLSMVSSGWMWNPYFGMYTYMPYRGSYYSPFGYRFWSPVTISQVYDRPTYNWGGNSGYAAGSSGMPTYNSNLGYTTADRTATVSPSSTYSSGTATTSTSSAAASSGASSRSSDTGGGRGGVGGGR